MTFTQGIQAMLTLLSFNMRTLETAEQLDSRFQMDFEALLNEAKQLQQKLRGLKDQIENLLGVEDSKRALIYEQVDLATGGVLLNSGEVSRQN